MNEESFSFGIALTVLAGVAGGIWAAPVKAMRRYAFEHWLFIMALFGQVALPWLVAFILCPHLKEAMLEIRAGALIQANLFSMSWGVANMLFGLCLIRIGFSLTFAIMTGIGIPVGVLVPMLMKGSGKFSDAPDLLSRAGLVIMAGVALILLAVALAAMAGHGRERSVGKVNGKGFLTGLLMAVVIGVLQVGLAFAFIYSNGAVIEALSTHGAGTGGASLAIWAFAMPGGAIVNLAFAACLMTKGRSWGVLADSPRDLFLALLVSAGFFSVFALMGAGMRLIGPLGASVGFGSAQAFQIISSQILGAALGEWGEASNRSKKLMVVSICAILLAVIVISSGRALQ